jgi:hypothetical protein
MGGTNVDKQVSVRAGFRQFEDREMSRSVSERKLCYRLVSAIIVTLTFLVSAAPSFAFSDSAESPWSTHVNCGVNLAFFGVEEGCAGTYTINPSIAIGARYVRSEVMDDDSESAVGLFECRPTQGSFHLDAGFGVGRWRDSNGSSWHWSAAGELRLGSRWTLPIGLTLGMQYAGVHILPGNNYAIFVLAGPELGWRF